MASADGHASPFRRRRYYGQDGHHVDVYFDGQQEFEEYEIEEYEEFSVYDDDDYTEVLIDDDGEVLPQSPVRSHRGSRSSKQSLKSPGNKRNSKNRGHAVQQSPLRRQPQGKSAGSPLPTGVKRRNSRKNLMTDQRQQGQNDSKTPVTTRPPPMPLIDDHPMSRKSGGSPLPTGVKRRNSRKNLMADQRQQGQNGNKTPVATRPPSIPIPLIDDHPTSRKKGGSPLPTGVKRRNSRRNLMTYRDEQLKKSPDGTRKPPFIPLIHDDSPMTNKNDFAAMVAAAASTRNDRVDSGGPLKLREAAVREDVPDEHRNVFRSVVDEAASLGRLVRMKEKVVEAVSHRPKDEDKWNGPAGLKLDVRSRAMIAIKEAAALGQLKCRKPQEVTNYNTSAVEEEKERINIDKDIDRTERAKFLLDHHFEDEKKEKKERWDDALSLDARSFHSIDDVELPAEDLPTIGKRSMKFTTREEALQNLSTHVAAAAWDRKFRLQRPKAELRMTRGCQCPFCKNPTPFQTNKYKAIHLDKSEHIPVSEARRRKRQIEKEMRMLYHPDEVEEEQKEQQKSPPPPPQISPVAPSPPISTTEKTADTSTDTDSFFQPSTRSLGPRVLLDETIDFGTIHKKVHIKRRKTRNQREEDRKGDSDVNKEKKSGSKRSTGSPACSTIQQNSKKNLEGKKEKKSSSTKAKPRRNRERGGACIIM